MIVLGAEINNVSQVQIHITTGFHEKILYLKNKYSCRNSSKISLNTMTSFFILQEVNFKVAEK